MNSWVASALFKEWGRHGWGTEREEDEKKEFAFAGFGHVKHEMLTLLTSGKKKEKHWMCKLVFKGDRDGPLRVISQGAAAKAMETEGPT